MALFVALVIVGVGILIATAFMGRQSIPDGLEINGLRIVKDGFVSISVLPLAGGEVALFDAGIDKTGKAILDELSRLGLGRENVKTIFLTHGHRDHIAGAPLFPNAQVMALSEEVDIAEGRTSPGGPKSLPPEPHRPGGLASQHEQFRMPVQTHLFTRETRAATITRTCVTSSPFGTRSWT